MVFWFSPEIITQNDEGEESCGNDRGGCDHDCRIIDGVPQCICLPGFELQGKTCKGRRTFYTFVF